VSKAVQTSEVFKNFFYLDMLAYIGWPLHACIFLSLWNEKYKIPRASYQFTGPSR